MRYSKKLSCSAVPERLRYREDTGDVTKFVFFLGVLRPRCWDVEGLWCVQCVLHYIGQVTSETLEQNGDCEYTGARVVRKSSRLSLSITKF